MTHNPFIKPIVIVLGIFVALFVVGKFFAPKDPAASVAATPNPASTTAEANNRKTEFDKKSAAEAMASGEKAKLGPKAVTIKSGLKYEDLVVGTGKEAKNGTTVDVLYTGWLTDGTKFDSTADHNNEPYSLSLPGQVIEGWNEGIPGMKQGGKRKLVIPAALGYGEAGQGTIPPGATLVFEIELVKVK